MTQGLFQYLGASFLIQDVVQQLERAAQGEAPVLLLGETGTGKTLAAHFLHERSARAKGPFVEVEGAQLTPEAWEGELFGSEHSPGALAKAEGGVLLLKEAHCMPLPLQVRWMQFLQTRQYSVGSSGMLREGSVRWVVSNTYDLLQAVQGKQFREDLFYRLQAVSIQLPPLRERLEDVPVLMRHFFKQLGGHTVQPPQGPILEALLAYEWPGNVRELKNLVERWVILKGSGPVELADLPHRIFQKFAKTQPQAAGATSAWEFPKMVLPGQGIELKSVVAAFENYLVDQALQRTNGNKNRASELLGMNRTTLVEKLRKRGMITALTKKGS